MRTAVQILVVNPNTTASMTETVAAAARSAAGAWTEIVAVTSSMGPVSIEGYYDEALAVPGLLVEIAAGERAGAQAAIIACFDDTGLDAARAMANIPVIGICEAALSLASFIAQRFTVVTTTTRSWVPVEALVPEGDGFRVFIVDAKNVVHAREVKVGSRDEKMAEILEGLTPGLRVVAFGAYGLEDGATIAPSK